MDQDYDDLLRWASDMASCGAAAPCDDPGDATASPPSACPAPSWAPKAEAKSRNETQDSVASTPTPSSSPSSAQHSLKEEPASDDAPSAAVRRTAVGSDTDDEGDDLQDSLPSLGRSFARSLVYVRLPDEARERVVVDYGLAIVFGVTCPADCTRSVMLNNVRAIQTQCVTAAGRSSPPAGSIVRLQRGVPPPRTAHAPFDRVSSSSRWSYAPLAYTADALAWLLDRLSTYRHPQFAVGVQCVTVSRDVDAVYERLQGARRPWSTAVSATRAVPPDAAQGENGDGAAAAPTPTMTTLPPPPSPPMTSPVSPPSVRPTVTMPGSLIGASGPARVRVSVADSRGRVQALAVRHSPDMPAAAAALKGTREWMVIGRTSCVEQRLTAVDARTAAAVFAATVTCVSRGREPAFVVVDDGTAYGPIVVPEDSLASAFAILFAPSPATSADAPGDAIPPLDDQRPEKVP
jgi:hypothetical protein